MATNTETFKVAGISHYKDDIIKNFASEEDDEFDYETSSVELIPEPENKYDPNAIKVMVDEIHVGYVPKQITSFVKDLINSPDFESIKILIIGIKSDDVYDEDDNLTEDIKLSATVSIYTKNDIDEEEPKVINPLYSKIELICGIIITLCSLITYKIFMVFGLFLILYSLWQLNKRKSE